MAARRRHTLLMMRPTAIDETIGSYDITLTYDNAGNTTTDQNDYTYTYTGACPGKPLAGNALGRRIKMVDHIAANNVNDRLYYYSDNWQVLEEYTVAAVPAKTSPLTSTDTSQSIQQ